MGPRNEMGTGCQVCYLSTIGKQKKNMYIEGNTNAFPRKQSPES